MKTILLMSCILCAGMNGSENGMDSVTRSDGTSPKSGSNEASLQNLMINQKTPSLKGAQGEMPPPDDTPAPQKKKSQTDINTEGVTESAPLQEGFAVALSQAQCEAYEARKQIYQKTEKTIWQLLDQKNPIDERELSQNILNIVMAYQSQLDEIDSKHDKEMSEESRTQNMRDSLNLIRNWMIDALDDLQCNFSETISKIEADIARIQKILSILRNVPTKE